MRGLRVLHHSLEVTLVPEKWTLVATDTMFLGGESAELLIYLGNGFTLIEASQGDHRLTFEMIEEQRRARRYRINGWDPTRMIVTLRWAGKVGEFELSKVCAVCPRLIELSGFGQWFPTVEPDCQEERFTYSLDVELPSDWDLVTPGVSADSNVRRRHFERQSPIEDMFLCAAPRFDCSQVRVGAQTLRLYSAGLPTSIRQAAADDFARSTQVITRHLGPMLPGHGGVAIISPRGEHGAEWGFERGDLWVVGNSLAELLAQNDWRLEFLPGAFSLSMHETIHAWFGLGLKFAEAWLAEAITQYLEMVFTEEAFSLPGNAEAFFSSYIPRIQAALAKDDRPVASLTHMDNHYAHWYLKGSWAFWDLEALVGRCALVEALAAVYRRHVGQTVRYNEFVHEMSELLRRSLGDHFDNWFKGRGFSPLWR